MHIQPILGNAETRNTAQSIQKVTQIICNFRPSNDARFAQMLRNNLMFSVIFCIVSSVAMSFLSLDVFTIINTAKILLVSILFHFSIFTLAKYTQNLGISVFLSILLLAVPALGAHVGVISNYAWWVISIGLTLVALGSIYDLIQEKFHAAICVPIITLLVSIQLTRPYTSFNIIQRLNSGEVHQDTLFHSAIAAMIKTYGVPSTGLSGLIPIKYHWFSHALIAGVSNISGVDVITSISIAPTLMFAPLLISLLVSYGSQFGKVSESSYHIVSTLVCLLLSAGYVLLRNWGVLLNNWYASESYLVGLILFIAFMMLDNHRLKPISYVLLICGFTIVCTLTKGPVGLAMASIQCGKCLNGISRKKIVNAAVSIISFYLASRFVVGGYGTPLRLLAFPRSWFLGKHYIELNSIVIGSIVLVIGLALHFIVPILVLCASRYSKDVSVVHKVLVTDLIVLVLFGIAAISFLDLGAGNEIYFSMISWMVGIPVVSTAAAVWLSKIRTRSSWHLPAVLLVPLALLIVLDRGSFFESIRMARLKAAPDEMVAMLTKISISNNHNFWNQSRLDARMKNPILRCSARPFLFPAVSNRAWFNLIESNVSPCDYFGYGYEDYKNNIVQQNSEMAVTQ